ncbi:hypothetical protein GDO81_020982 [Engystomops pustulosus]|uniref:Uncharacterized protein n=1 Tax=Engystomops pustulosus TaxID=76066 RepID=A0AAV6ZJE6_ENGPU|nr:hypothetical protein GDO81_020982 [Engystomops pustulosus]
MVDFNCPFANCIFRYGSFGCGWIDFARPLGIDRSIGIFGSGCRDSVNSSRINKRYNRVNYLANCILSYSRFRLRWRGFARSLAINDNIGILGRGWRNLLRTKPPGSMTVKVGKEWPDP